MPGDTHRVAILGQTGSGKTMAGIWHLSRRRFDRMPWIIFDFKGDEHIESLPARELKITRHPPTSPGLYVVRPMPGQEDEVETFLWRTWKNGRTGLYFDEGYMVTGSDAFRAILTQGRSKRLPAIILSQRPMWMDNFVFTEASFFQVFHLLYKKDRDKVDAFVNADMEKRLPDYHSWWYQVGRDKLSVLGPVDHNRTVRRIRNRTGKTIWV